MSVDAVLRDAMLVAIPDLRAFAISLTSNPDRSGDTASRGGSGSRMKPPPSALLRAEPW
jgi:hypothetical protein